MGLRLAEIVKILKAKIITGNDKLNIMIEFACASDLMSDILRGNVENCLLITGLNSVQTIKTAVISNISAIVLVRDKEPLQEVIEEAKKYELPFLSTPFTMYTACGRLFSKGLKGVDGRQDTRKKNYSKEEFQDKV